MAVRRGTAHRLCREIAACAAAIFHHHGISETLAELLPDKAGDHVGYAAGGECNLERDGLRRIGLGRCRPCATDDGRWWHHRTPIELAIPGLLVLPRAQDQRPACPFESLLGETHPRLLGAKRHIVVVKHQHWFLFVLCLFMALGWASTLPLRCGRRRLQA